MTCIVGVDLSLTSTGLARILTRDALGAEVTVRRVLSKPPPADKVTLATRSTRLRRIAADVFTACAGADLVVVEGPTYASDSGAAHDRAGLWWLVLARLTAQGFNVVEVSPTTVKTYALGRGGGPETGKDAMIAAVVRRYPTVPVSGNDEADALVLAAMGARFTGHPIEDTLPQTHLRAMTAVKWTPTR